VFPVRRRIGRATNWTASLEQAHVHDGAPAKETNARTSGRGRDGTRRRNQGRGRRKEGWRGKKKKEGGETRTRVCRSERLTGTVVDGMGRTAVAQDVPDQEEAGEETEAKQAHPTVDPLPHRKHHPLQRQTQALASHQAQPLVLRLGGDA